MLNINRLFSPQNQRNGGSKDLAGLIVSEYIQNVKVLMNCLMVSPWILYFRLKISCLEPIAKVWFYINKYSPVLGNVLIQTPESQ